MLAAALAGAALFGGLVRPVLAADATALTLVDGMHRRRVPWAHVLSVRAITPPRRHGVRPTSLEVELTDDRLVLVPSYLLDSPVEEVSAALAALWPGAPPPAG